MSFFENFFGSDEAPSSDINPETGNFKPEKKVKAPEFPLTEEYAFTQIVMLASTHISEVERSKRAVLLENLYRTELESNGVALPPGEKLLIPGVGNWKLRADPTPDKDPSNPNHMIYSYFLDEEDEPALSQKEIQERL